MLKLKIPSRLVYIMNKLTDVNIKGSNFMLLGYSEELLILQHTQHRITGLIDFSEKKIKRFILLCIMTEKKNIILLILGEKCSIY